MQSFTFICGCGHSGTTLIANMFASHPEIYIPLVETGLFIHKGEAREAWKTALAQAEASGRPHFAEKTPRHIRRLGLIRSLVPKARFVLMVRDGRDVAASYIRRTGSATRGRERWLRENRVVLKNEGAKDAYILRLEDLVSDTETSLKKVCAFAGVPYSPEMLRFHEKNNLWFGLSRIEKGSGWRSPGNDRLRNWQVNQPIFDSRGAWRNILPKEEAACFDQGELREMLDRFGYE